MNLAMRDPRAYGPDPHPIHPQWISQIRIIKSYTEDQAGQDIRPEDVVRPTNHCWCIGGNDINEHGRCWTQKSRARRPTYGSCIVCMDAGPVGQTCLKCTEECTENGQRAVYWMIGRGEEPRMMILDSLHLAQMFWAETVIANADHCYFPNEGERFYKLDGIHLDRLVDRWWHRSFNARTAATK